VNQVTTPRTLREIMDAYERNIIVKAVEAAGGSRTVAARALGIGRCRLYARIHRLKIDLSKIPARAGRPRKQEEEPCPKKW